jgi:hypothetical protein
MIRKRGRIQHGLVVLASMAPAWKDLVGGLWEGPARKRWLLPLMVFLCLTAVLLLLAATVEVLAPFIYSIF